MKGHLDEEQLKSMKREDLQALAKDMGVSAGGKTEEIIARIAAVEVDREQEEAAQAAKEAEEKAEAEQKAREEEKAAGLSTVKVVTRFLDKHLNQIKNTGETYKVSEQRAAELVAAGVAEIEQTAGVTKE